MSITAESETLPLRPDQSPGREVVITVADLYKQFGSQNVLNGVSFTLRKNENLVVLGKSGTGKSVLIKCIAGLLLPDSGTITVLGQNLGQLHRKDLEKLRQHIGFLFQSGALYDSMTVRENLEFPLQRIKKNLNAKQRLEKITQALENVGLVKAIDKMPSQLSGGMRKRVSLARTVVIDPDIILYDEPTTGLDPVTSDEISELINEIQDKYHTSSIIITHDIQCARHTGNRVLMLHEGKIYKEGTFTQFEHSTDTLIRSFFKSERNAHTRIQI